MPYSREERNFQREFLKRRASALLRIKGLLNYSKRVAIVVSKFLDSTDFSAE
jgi:hypothetical protein